jgi:hypothetical protein
MDNTEIFRIVLSQVIRHLLSGLAGALTLYGVTADQQTAVVSATTAILVSAVIVVVTQGWSYISKWLAIHMIPPGK